MVDGCLDKPTVNKIIEAAVKLFSLKGLAGVSVKELAEAAGVNVALISYYFGGKEKLYSYIIEHQLMVMGKELETIHRKTQDPVEKIRLFVYTAVAIHKQNPHIDLLLYRELFSPTDCFEAIVKVEAERLHEFLDGCIRAAMASGKFRRDLDIHCATISLFSMIHFTFFTRCLPNTKLCAKEDQEEYYVEQALEIYFNGVMSPGAKRGARPS
ncbi:hypothetical protein P22_0988 [Propionispora sp. 2/2-37]|uniref:TetR/AcrR family transcriptional regulator n=1 Tax=Propionispora sp. 2/2-37 TaxID=1677858 RepID=UPI0006BB7486|nr:CerR family C-terminal domain-containing protein [Propionispora sp. 2/2-37]CUH94919.1 hypothetical protein P22_0988 [Propionispora sp. 2/2-37]